ncbi:MAG: hypothetical protein MGG11_08500 [Trichodesmium sp. MAG_R03]|nr:hypothetical protein [Trichodesmium sp. MAG_R03]
MSPIFRQQWHSVYKALEDCHPLRYNPQTWTPEEQKLEVEHPLLGKLQIIAWHKLYF